MRPGSNIRNRFRCILLIFLTSITFSISKAQEISKRDILENISFSSLAKRNNECVFAVGKSRYGATVFVDACIDKVSFKIADPFGSAFAPFQFTFPDSGWGILGGSLVRISRKQLGPVSIGIENTRFNALYFENDSSGWVIGDEGLILRTTDGGLSWTKQESGTDVDLFAISGSFDGIVWASGWKRTQPAGAEREYRTIVSYDYGRNWSVIVSEMLREVDHITFLDAKIGYALQSDGDLIKTNDGGESWTSLDGPEGIGGFYFLNSQIGWIFDQKRLYRTNDGGKQWQPLFIIPSGLFLEHGRLVFLNPTDGWMIGGSYFLRTEDGGKTWQAVDFRSGLEL